jgi:hypothetical protein
VVTENSSEMAMIVAIQRTTVQMMMNAVPARGTWPSIADPREALKTISAEAIPPSTTVASMSGKAMSRLARNLRSVGT